MKISPTDLDGFESLDGAEWEGHKLRYIFLHNRWEELFGIELARNSFLARWLTDVVYLNQKGERLANEWNDGNDLLANTDKVILQFNHIELEYISPRIEEKRPASLSARNLQFDLSKAQTPPDAAQFFDERARAALYLVQTAKALGWKEISFKGTSDPYDRLALDIACKMVGLQTAEKFDPLDLPVRDVVLKPNHAGKDPRDVSYKKMLFHVKKTLEAKDPDTSGLLPRTYPKATETLKPVGWGDLEAAL